MCHSLVYEIIFIKYIFVILLVFLCVPTNKIKTPINITSTKNIFMNSTLLKGIKGNFPLQGYKLSMKYVFVYPCLTVL